MTTFIVATALTVFALTPWGQAFIKIVLGIMSSTVIIALMFGIMYLSASLFI